MTPIRELLYFCFFSFFVFVVGTPPSQQPRGPSLCLQAMGYKQNNRQAVLVLVPVVVVVVMVVVAVVVVVVVEVVVGGGLGTTHGAPVFVCRWRLLWGGALEQHMGLQSLFAGGGCCGGGALEQHTGLQSLFAGGGCCGGGGALEQQTGLQSLFAGGALSHIQGFVLLCEACNLI